MPHPESAESMIFDLLLTVSNGAVIIIGSYSLIKCLRKRSKQASKLGGKMLRRKSKSDSPKSKSKKAQVHPAPAASPTKLSRKMSRVHPEPAGGAAAQAPAFMGMLSIAVGSDNPVGADGSVPDEFTAQIVGALRSTLGVDGVTIRKIRASNDGGGRSRGRGTKKRTKIAVEYEVTSTDAAVVQDAVARTAKANAGPLLVAALKAKGARFVTGVEYEGLISRRR